MSSIHSDFHFEKGISALSFVNLDNSKLIEILSWRNHVEISRWMLNSSMISQSCHLEFIEKLKKDENNGYWMVIENGEPSGCFYLNSICYLHRHAFMGLYSRPDKITGKGKIIFATGLKIAFEQLKLHTVKLEALESNEKAVRFYLKSGLTEEGRKKEFVYRDNRFQDLILFGITEEKYASINKHC